MRDLHDPNNPDYFKREEREDDLTFDLIMKDLPEVYQELIEEEISTIQIDANWSRKRISNIRNEITLLIEVMEQTKNTYAVNQLKKLLEL